jgi:hypothetical protein
VGRSGGNHVRSLQKTQILKSECLKISAVPCDVTACMYLHASKHKHTHTHTHTHVHTDKHNTHTRTHTHRSLYILTFEKMSLSSHRT